MDSSSENSALNEILIHLRNIDNRVSRLEEKLNIQRYTDEDEQEEYHKSTSQVKVEETKDALEERIAQLWLPRVGIIVLIIGFAFLLTLPHKDLPVFLPGLIGYFIAAALFGLSKFWKNSYTHISSYLTTGSFVILYLTTMRLYFFGFEKTIENFPVILGLLLLITIVTLVTSYRVSSANLASLGILFGFLTAILSDSSYFIFVSITFLSIATVFFKLKYNWNVFLFYGMFLAYLTHLLWFINNPVMGNSIETVSTPAINLFFVLLYIIIFSSVNYLDKRDEEEDLLSASIAMINSAMGYGLFLLVTLLTTHSSIHHFLAAIVFLAIARTLWIKKENRYTTFFYAMFGYAALSISIVLQFAKPDYFTWLCWQSLLVVSTALWFRSKFIIVANFVIYLIIFLAYLALDGSSGGISLSFGVVALLSARILHWKKDKLELQTEMMRNAYLISALFIIPYSLFEIFPGGYVTLSWIAVAIIYYILSVLLNNKKYRWMALATYFLTVIYVFILGITSTETIFKIISFLVLGATLLVVSLVYAKKKGKD
jgi:uncharacterized membrane protein